MHPGSWSGYSPFMFCVDGLVPLPVFRLNLSVYKFGKRSFPQFKKSLFKIVIIPVIKEPERPSSGCGIINDFSNQYVIIPEVQLVTYPDLSRGVDQNVP